MNHVGRKPEVQLDIAERYAAGERVQDLAREYGVSRYTIDMTIRRMGGQLRRRTARRSTTHEWYRQNHQGYVRWVLYLPPHKRRHPVEEKVRILEHRLVMEEAIGRALESHEQVHHRNGIKTDNRLENLELRVGPHGKGMTHCPHCGESLTPEDPMSDLKRPPRGDVYRACMPGIELRANGDKPTQMVGYATVWDAPTIISSRWEGTFVEKWKRGAFTKSIAERGDQVKVLLNHGKDPTTGDKPLGKITELEEDDHGLRYSVDLLDDAPYVRAIIPALRAGLFGASHRFTTVRDAWVDDVKPSPSNPDAIQERTVLEAKLHELGPVTWAALPIATAGIRSLTDTIHDVDAITLATPILLDEERLGHATAWIRRDLEPAPKQPEHSTVEQLHARTASIHQLMLSSERSLTLDDPTVEALGSLLEVCDSACEAMESLLGLDDDTMPDEDDPMGTGMNSEEPSGTVRDDAPPVGDAEPAKAHLSRGRRETSPSEKWWRKHAKTEVPSSWRR